MHVPTEEEEAVPAVVPAGSGGQHILIFPDIGLIAKGREIALGLIDQGSRLDENRVGEHIDIVLKSEHLDFGVVGAVLAFNQLSVLVAHRAAVGKDGDAVLGVVVQVTGTQHIVVFVLQLHQRTPELSQILVHPIHQFVAGQLSAFLQDFHMADSVDIAFVHIPIGCIAN